MKDYYRILQVDPSAEPEVIDAAYRRLARKYHPDSNPSPDAMRRMQEINEAYEVLRDPMRRAEHERQRRARTADTSAEEHRREKEAEAEKQRRSQAAQEELHRRQAEEAERERQRAQAAREAQEEELRRQESQTNRRESITVLTKPSKASFELAKGMVNTTNTLIGLVIAGAINGLLVGFRSGVGGLVVGLIFGPIITLIGYYVGSAILWVVAKVLGGKGDFMLQANLLATFVVPLFVVNLILGLIPVVGALIMLLVNLYWLYLTTLGLQVIHGYTTLKAVLTWLIFWFIVLVIAFFIAGAAV